MSTTITFGPGGIRNVGDHRVYYRAAWADEWTQWTSMQAVNVVWSCAPTLPTATLLWRYGWIKQVDAATPAEVAKLAGVTSLYVKIEIDATYSGGSWSTATWYGILSFADDQLGGSTFRGAPVNVIATGEQTFTCYGLEKLLVDHIIRTSWVAFGATDFIGRGLTFNRRGIGNRSAAAAPGYTSYGFEPDPDLGVLWSSLDIVNHVLEFQTPRDETDAVEVPFILQDDSQIPDWDSPEIDSDRQTAYSLLDRIINRKRLLLWWLEVDEEEDPAVVTLHTNTMLASALTIPLTGAPTIPANSSQIDLQFDSDTLTTAAVRTSDVEKVDVVIAQGARRRSVATFSIIDATLETGWAPADETLYIAGASGDADYGALSIKDKQKRNADFRSSPAMEKVYAFFRIPDYWDFQTADGIGGEAMAMFPDDVDVDLVYPQYFPDLYIEQTMPLIAGVDYAGDSELGLLPTEPDEDRDELSPLVFFRRPETATGWVRAEDIAKTAGLEEDDEDANNRFSCSVRVPRDSRGLFIRVHGEPGQHAIATYTFSRLPTDEHPGGYRYESGKMLVTMSLVDDRCVEGRWPATDPTSETLRYMVIDAGDGYRKDYLVPDTVVGVASDGTLIRTVGGFLPVESDDDDQHRLVAIAKVAASWHTVTHNVLSLQTHRLRIDIGLGDLVTTIGDTADGHRQTLNTPVTQIEVTIPQDASDPIMVITTWAGELDPMQLLPRPIPPHPPGAPTAGQAQQSSAFQPLIAKPDPNWDKNG